MIQPDSPPSGAASEAATRPRYVIDPTVSRFTVQAFAGGMLSALGHDPTFVARDFTGDVSFDPATPDAASLTMSMRAVSLTLVDDVTDTERRTIERTMQEDVLESARFPEITYRCAKAAVRQVSLGHFEVSLNGTLTLHGVTYPQPIAATLTASGTTLRAFGEFIVRQSDYDIKPVSVAGSMLKVKDELKCSFDIGARR